MKYLGIDWGERNIGLSSSSGEIADIYGQIKYDGDMGRAVEKVMRIVKDEEVEEVVVGVSEGEMEKKTREFGKMLEERGVKVVYWDETLSSQKACQKMIESGMRRSKRRGVEHGAAAAVILNDYLEEKDG